ncbi:MAG: pentapeptide repeat-containing protein [Rhizobiales bacterium]|nr:pentapeptide repeat-containing protein [Hyphomicrobiales bacterium]
MLAAMDARAEQHNRHVVELFLWRVRPHTSSDGARVEARHKWNKWRLENSAICARFTNVDFTIVENRGISFSGMFIGNVDFSGSKFAFMNEFQETIFGEYANFCDAIFDFDVNFIDAEFGGGARFKRAKFGSANFRGASFLEGADFAGAQFEGIADFQSVAFGYGIFFNAAVFVGGANFAGATATSWFERKHNIRQGALAKGTERERYRSLRLLQEKHSNEGYGPHCFLSLDLSNVRIGGPLIFRNRAVDGPVSLSGARAPAPPDLDGATNLQRIDFTGAEVGFAPPDQPRWRRHWTEDSSVPIRLRAFRKVAEDTKNHDLERDLYIEERKAERGVHRRRLRDAFFAERNDLKQIARLGPLFVHWCWRRVMDLYWLFSDYGRSLIRPLLALAVTLPLFVSAFDASLAGKRAAAVEDARRIPTGSPEEREAAAQATEAEYRAATRQLAFSNAIPFVGSLSIDGEVKKFLLCGAPPVDETKLKRCVPIAPGWYQATMIAQNVLSALLLFFFGLALRNYFRVK